MLSKPFCGIVLFFTCVSMVLTYAVVTPPLAYALLVVQAVVAGFEVHLLTR